MTIYKEITDKIIKELKKGNIPWTKPWTGSAGHANLKSKKEYRGINTILLSLNDYTCEYWLTFKQAKEFGGKVKKGEKGTKIVFWKQSKIKDKETDEIKYIPFAKSYTVFNLEQTEGIDIPEAEQIKFNPVEKAEGIIEGYKTKPSITFKENRAYYSPVNDYINMPAKENFLSVEEYYSTLFHEIGHSTLHEKRLNRKFLGGTAEKRYAKEELVAELTSCFLCKSSGIEKTIKNSAAYIQSWLKALDNDDKLIVSASNKAQKAKDYILE